METGPVTEVIRADRPVSDPLSTDMNPPPPDGPGDGVVAYGANSFHAFHCNRSENCSPAVCRTVTSPGLSGENRGDKGLGGSAFGRPLRQTCLIGEFPVYEVRDLGEPSRQRLWDTLRTLKAEGQENTEREPLTPAEIKRAMDRLLPLAREAAKERQGTRTDLQLQPPVGGSSECHTKALEEVGAALGAVVGQLVALDFDRERPASYVEAKRSAPTGSVRMV